MKITNKSGKIIGIGDTVLVPGQEAEVDNKFAGNGTLKTFVDMGFITIVKEPVKAAETEETVEAENTAKTPKSKKAKAVQPEADETKE